MDMGDHAEAQRTVEEASRKTERNYVRKRLLADAALLNGDTETAIEAMADVVRNDSTPGAVTVADRLMLVRSLVEAGTLVEAERALDEITPQRLETAGLDERASWQALRALMKPDAERARVAGLRNAWMATPFDAQTRLDIVRAAMALGDRELATAMTHALFASDEIRRVFKVVRDLFEAQGMSPVFRELQRRAALQKISHGDDVPPEAPLQGV
ncbi:hypothetical protein SDC9_110297 [bioreactor metagenome]